MSELLRFNEGKAELSYILQQGRANELASEVWARGALKYDRLNWQRKGDKAKLEETLNSLIRHAQARLLGEIYDPDMGTDHLANLFCCAVIALFHHGVEPVITREEYKTKLEKARA
jgi:hypothetical protein